MEEKDRINENLHTLLNEVNEAHRLQQESIDLLYNKMNWVLVSNLIFFAAVLVLILLTLSCLVTLYGFKPKVFNFTTKFSSQLEIYHKEGYIISLVKKKKEAFNKNLRLIKEIHDTLWLASTLLATALVVQLIIISKFLCMNLN